MLVLVCVFVYVCTVAWTCRSEDNCGRWCSLSTTGLSSKYLSLLSQLAGPYT